MIGRFVTSKGSRLKSTLQKVYGLKDVEFNRKPHDHDLRRSSGLEISSQPQNSYDVIPGVISTTPQNRFSAISLSHLMLVVDC